VTQSWVSELPDLGLPVADGTATGRAWGDSLPWDAFSLGEAVARRAECSLLSPLER
jgi:hypothetical protein